MPTQFEHIPEFAQNEIQDAIDRLKGGKAGDNSGVRAEQRKNCSDMTREKIRQIFNEILLHEDCTPKTWRRIGSSAKRVTENTQAITGRFAVCQFATVLYARLAPSLHEVQPPDQGGFRSDHQTVDHLMVYKVLEQRCREWNVPLYISTIDLMKAFDRTRHSACGRRWNTMGLKPAYLRLLQRLYSHQEEGTVLTDEESDVFPSNRARNKGTHCRAYCLTRYCSSHRKAIWSDGRKNKKVSDWAT